MSQRQMSQPWFDCSTAMYSFSLVPVLGYFKFKFTVHENFLLVHWIRWIVAILLGVVASAVINVAYTLGLV